MVVTGIPPASQEVTDTAIYDAFAQYGLIERVIVQRCADGGWLTVAMVHVLTARVVL